METVETGTAGTRSRAAAGRRALALGAISAAVALASAGVAAPPDAAPPDAASARRVGAFSEAGGRLPEGWAPLAFAKVPRQTEYTLVRDPAPDGNGDWVVRAVSHSSASGLKRSLSLDLRRFPLLRWRWRVAAAVAKARPRLRSGDDYAARVYITFEYAPERIGVWTRVRYLAARALFGDLPVAALTYVWASLAEIDETFDNPYAAGFVKMIVVESGDAHAGVWREEERNVYEDYLRVFGREPPPVDGLAIMTDTDDTGGSATAYYGDLVFLPAQAGPP